MSSPLSQTIVATFNHIDSDFRTRYNIWKCVTKVFYLCIFKHNMVEKEYIIPWLNVWSAFSVQICFLLNFRINFYQERTLILSLILRRLVFPDSLPACNHTLQFSAEYHTSMVDAKENIILTCTDDRMRVLEVI